MKRTFTPPTHPLGDRLAPKIAVLVKHILDEHLRTSGAHRAKIGTQAAIDFFRTISDERDEHWTPLIRHLIDAADMHPDVKRALEFMAHGQGEGAALGALQMIGGTAVGGLGQAIGYLLAPTVQAVAWNHRYTLLDPATSAAAAARGIISQDELLREAGWQALHDKRAIALLEMAKSRPDPSMLLTLVRRGIISEAEFLAYMRLNGFGDVSAHEILQVRREIVSPADAALAALRGNLSTDDAAKLAAESGFDRKAFDLLVANTGEPPGTEQLLEAYRRGFIDKQRLEKGIRESRVRNEWVDVVERLRLQRASPADAIRGVVQNHISDGDGKKIAEEGGLDPQDWGWMVQTAGNPPGPMQMIELWRRGHMTQAEVEQGIREGRTKNKYIPHLINLKRVLPEGRQIIGMVTRGGLTEAEGARLLHERGYDETVTRALIHSATSAQASREKEIARGEITELYYDHAIDEQQAIHHLHVLGYTTETAKLVLSIMDLKRERALQHAAMSPIRTEYIARRIDENEARTRLNTIGIPHKQVELAVKLWTVDREAHTKLLTEAQVVRAHKKGLLDRAGAETRLRALGYHAADARLLIEME